MGGGGRLGHEAAEIQARAEILQVSENSVRSFLNTYYVAGKGYKFKNCILLLCLDIIYVGIR